MARTTHDIAGMHQGQLCAALAHHQVRVGSFEHPLETSTYRDHLTQTANDPGEIGKFVQLEVPERLSLKDLGKTQALPPAM